MYSLKLHFETALKPEHFQDSIKNLELNEKSKKMGRVKDGDNIRVKHEININAMGLSLGPVRHNMQMDQVIRFNNKKEFKKALLEKAANFRGNEKVAMLRKNQNFKQTLTIYKMDFVHEIPDFVIDCLAQDLPTLGVEYKAAAKNSPFTQVQSTKLLQTIENVKKTTPADRAPALEKLAYFLIVQTLLTLAYYSAVVVASPVMMYMSLVATGLVGLDFLIRSPYKTAFRIASVTNDREKTALYAGFSQGFSALLSQIKHPFAFFAGRLLARTKDEAILNELRKLDPNFNPPPQKRPSELSYEAIMKRFEKEAQLKRQVEQKSVQFTPANQLYTAPAVEQNQQCAQEEKATKAIQP